nr:Mu-like prophage major head subunit gpT family protein [Pseudomonas aeruginosa]
MIPSTTASNTYGWLGQFPKLREWIGQRVIKDMAAQGYQITNKLFESTVGVKRTDIEDDNLGVYGPLMQEMGRAAGAHPDELVFALLKAGNANLLRRSKLLRHRSPGLSERGWHRHGDHR